jgi:hypothetical protein
MMGLICPSPQPPGHIQKDPQSFIHSIDFGETQKWKWEGVDNVILTLFSRMVLLVTN